MADKKKTGVTGNGIYTVGDPSVAKDAIGKVDWIAVKVGGSDGATPEQLEAFKKALEGSGTELVIWQSEASQEGVDAVNKYGAAGYIAQAESEDQLNKARSIEDQINVPKSIITDKNITSDMSGWGWMFEYYANDPNTGLGQQNLADIVRWWKEQGAEDITVVIGSWGSKTMSMEEYQRQIEALRAAGFDIDNLASYRWDMMSQEQRDAYINWLNNLSAAGDKKPQAGGPSIGGSPPGNTGDQGDAKKAKKDAQKITRGPGGSGDHGDAEEAREEAKILAQAPAPYEGGRDVETSWADIDKLGRPYTVTITESGAVVEQVAGKAPYRIGWVPPGDTNLDNMVSGGYDKNPYTVGGWERESGGQGQEDPNLRGLTGTKSEKEAMDELKGDLTSDDKYGDRPKEQEEWEKYMKDNPGATDPHKTENPESYPPPDTIFPDPEKTGGGTTKMM